MSPRSAVPVTTADAVALCESRPEAEAQIAAFAAADPELLVAAWQDTPVVYLLAADETPVLVVDGARLIQVPSEVQRLLGPEAPPVAGPVWWVDIHALAAHDGAAAAALRLAQTLVDHHGGSVWPGATR